jgi:predicted DsbA family dithiol-disulfide isomerase
VVQVEIWADVVCPWCYIGKRRFEAALERFAQRDEVEVVHRSFQLDPSARRGVIRPAGDALAEKYGEANLDQMFARVESVAAAEGLDYHLARGSSGNTADAHRVLHAAAAAGVGEKGWELLYRAHFTDDRSVFARDSLVELATEAGLDREHAETVLDSNRFAAEVEEDSRIAVSLGATGVPFFVADRRVGVAGAQPVEVLLAMLEQAWQSAHPVQIVASNDGETCTDGACL